MSGFRCDECGKRYRTLKAAERAQRDGCAAGCSGLDIHEIDDAPKSVPSDCDCGGDAVPGVGLNGEAMLVHECRDASAVRGAA
jgi:hypothetical protein